MQILGFFALGGGVVWGGEGVVVDDFTLSAIDVGLNGLIAATAAAGSASVEAVRNSESLKVSKKAKIIGSTEPRVESKVNGCTSFPV